MNRPTALIAEDEPLMRQRLKEKLADAWPELHVVAEAADGDEAVRLALDVQPDVVVMDAAMPGTGGLEATRTLLERAPAMAVLMLSMHSEQTVVQQALAAGVRGYVLKNALDLDLASAVRRVAAGERVLDPALAQQTPLAGQRTRLTARELEVLQLICEGLSSRQIAAKLQVSANTVGVHRANIMNALGIHKTAELVVYALQNGLVNPL